MKTKLIVMEPDGTRKMEVQAALLSLAALAWADKVQPACPVQVVVATSRPLPLQVSVYTIKKHRDGHFEVESGGGENCIEVVLAAVLQRKFPGLVWEQQARCMWTTAAPEGFQAVFDARLGWGMSVLLSSGEDEKNNQIDAVASDLARVMREQADKLCGGA